MNSKKAAFMIGISMKAGKIAGGEVAAEMAVKAGNACLLILSEDASDNTVKKFSNMAAYRDIPVRRFALKAELGRMIGKGERSVIVVTDRGLADNILQQLDDRATE